MKLQKTIKAKIIALTKRKEHLLSQEYQNYQLLLKSLFTNEPCCIDFYKEVSLYSATRQQALRFIKKASGEELKEQPLIIRNDLIKIQNQNTKIAKYWAKIPLDNPDEKKGGGIWVPIEMPYNQYWEREIR